MEGQIDWSYIADFVVSLGDKVKDLSFEDAFDIGLNAQVGYEIGESVLPIYRVDGKLGIYFFIGKLSVIAKSIKQFIRENTK